jgi:tetratricopeptide (TPR) repeat protein
LENNLAIQTDKSTILSQQLVSGLSQSSGKVLNSIFADPNYKLQIAYYLFNSGKSEESIRIASGEVKQNSKNLYALEALAIFSTQLNDSKSAIEARKQITSLDPWNAKNYLQLLLLYKATGDTENALLMKEKILSFAPQTNEAKIALEEMTK